MIKSIIKNAYEQYWEYVENHVDDEGWVYTRDVPHMLDAYFEHNTGKPIEFQKTFGPSGDNPHFTTKGSRWRPKVISEYFKQQKNE